jgi:hypothetical protein
MKRNLFGTFVLFASIFSASTASAQLSEKFNSRPGVSLEQVRSHLQSHCWAFPDFDVNRHNWVPSIEGDGAMVSGPSSNPTQTTGIITPVLDVAGQITVSFKYKLHNAVGNGNRRWLKIYLTEADGTIIQRLDSIEFDKIHPPTVYDYAKTFNYLGSGLYKLYFNYQGEGGSARIAIDELMISANLKYNEGCNNAPVAVDDLIKGQSNRTASGFVCANDYDPNLDPFTPYLVTSSPDGTVQFNADGSFTFSPNPGFSGNQTTFKYRICDEGYGPLCSNEATVTVNFASGAMLPVSLVDFSGNYLNDGDVELKWTTTFESNSDKFDIERSLDGIKWETSGTVKAQGNSTVKHNYRYIDHVSRNSALKKDLYYRLKQVDKDGRNALTRILIVRVYNTRSLKMVSVTPNPSRNDIAVNVQLNEPSFVTMKIMNNNGAEVMRKAVKASEGSSIFLMDGSSKLQPGMYVLEVIINSKERMIVKLIKE